MDASSFLIKSTKNNAFGTAFCVQKNQRGAYLVTCTYVVEDCGIDSMKIDAKEVKLIAKGSRESIDLAVVYVEGLVDCKVLKLSSSSVEANQAFYIDGFKEHNKHNKNHRLERLNGLINKTSKIYSASTSIDTYSLLIDNVDSIEKGYSGSAIVVNGLVVAVATDRNTDGKKAYAVPIGYLKEVWEEIPNKVFVKVLEQKNGFEDFKNKLIEENSPLKVGHFHIISSKR